MKKIFTVIVTYNAIRWIKYCLQSIFESTILTNVIIVDNNSSDNTISFIKQHFPNVTLLPQKENLGFGQANNIGIKYALENDASYVLLLNQDAYLQPDALAKMIAESDEESLLSPLHLNGDGTKIDEMFRISLKNAHNYMNDDLLIRHQLGNSYPTEEICAACWLMPINVIKKIGGFNPLFFHYGEDNNYYCRMVYHNIKTILVPYAQVFHDREVIGNQQMYNKKITRREILIIACNINLSFIQRVKKIAVRLFEHPVSGISSVLWILSHFHKIINSRKKEKEIGLTWL